MISRWITIIVLTCLGGLSGCTSISVERTSTQQTIAEQRSDILSAGRLSSTSVGILTQSGLLFGECERAPLPCIAHINANKQSLNEINRLDVLTELWLVRALQIDKKSPVVTPQTEEVMNAYLNASRYAYARLFVATPKQTDVDNFDSQRLKIRDFYNVSAQRMGQLYDQAYKTDPTFAQQPYMKNIHIVSDVDAPEQSALTELTSTVEISFKTLRVRHRQEGIGAPFVAVFPSPSQENNAIINPGYVGVSAVFDYAGSSVDEVLHAPQSTLKVVRTNSTNTVVIRDKKVAVASDFSAPIALWMSHNQFYRNALKGLISSKHSLPEPKLYMLEPFDPKRRVLILLHGLASSPETWLNVSNELMADEQIRQGYQTWLVAYPTQLTIPINRAHIQQLIQTTLQKVDPAQTSFANQHVVLAGHSMGGVISRLLVSDSGQRFWSLITDGGTDLTPEERTQLAPVQPYLEFKPMPNVRRVIFVSSPHAGAPIARKWYTRWVGSLLKLPAHSIKGISQGMANISHVMMGRRSSGQMPKNPLSSITSLSDQDAWTRLAKDLPIAPNVVTHSIIGRENESITLLNSSDGVVPYRSAHLEGTKSELVIHSGHSALDQPEAWIEIKRILHEELNSK